MNLMIDNLNNNLEFPQYAYKIYQLLINFTYKETLNQFINQKGQFKKTFYYILKSVCENG